MSNNDLLSLLKIAVDSALRAGQFLTQSHEVSRRIHQEFAHDIKIDADRQSEKIILDYLRQNSSIPILSEETPSKDILQNSLRWVVDPIDGSFNFQRQIPLSCVSIGLWQGQDPLLGVVYDFYRSELFSGIVSKGAWLNDVPIKVSTTAARENAVLFSGFPAGIDLDTADFSPLLTQIRSYRKMRWVGSAALSLAYVACGRADAYYEKGIMLWDVAGAIPIVLGAGGLCRHDKSNGDFTYDVFASNGQLTSV